MGRPKGSKNKTSKADKDAKLSDGAKAAITKFNTNEAIDGAGFLALTYMYAEGPINWMSQIIAWLTETPVEERAEEAADILYEIQKYVGNPSEKLVLLGLSIGLKQTTKVLKEAKVLTEITEDTRIKDLELTRETLQKQLRIAGQMPDEQRIVFETEINKRLEEIEIAINDKTRLDARLAAEAERRMFYIKWATAAGMAYTTIIFLKSYEFSEAIENATITG